MRESTPEEVRTMEARDRSRREFEEWRELRIRQLVAKTQPLAGMQAYSGYGSGGDSMYASIDGCLDQRWLPVSVVRQLKAEGWIP